MDGKEALRRVPSVDQLINDPTVQQAIGGLPQPARTAAARLALDRLRRELLSDDAKGREPPLFSTADLAARVALSARELLAPSFSRVINATGVIIHTNLGRSPLADEAAQAVAGIAGTYSNLEYDLEKGGRGQRTGKIEEMLVAVTGARAALVVNNNAAAVFLVLSVLAPGREVIVSRGELVEIGGSFRIPEIMAAGGCLLREVGTTNKTHLPDYERAVGAQTALIMKVHTSNYKIIGFTKLVPLEDLVQLGRAKEIPVVEDLGSGNLVDLHEIGEPQVAQRIKQGADLVTFSGDKLLGGPQAGIVVGRADLIEKLKNHPIYRAVRLGKLAIAALEATLRLYLYDDPLNKVPVLAVINQAPPVIEARARLLAQKLSGLRGFDVETIATTAVVGGGAVPDKELKSWGVRLRPVAGGPDKLAAALRKAAVPVIARVEDDVVVLDMIAVKDTDLEAIEASLDESNAG